ncbi:hypothetical protein [Thermotoga caldifontis]|uniref:hypothetical protein n=1 Tax=Thermotoga caldifontis TaxID=1508419 RepID=UPI000596EB02|nr:hypothetical protein [Thermotoga caldifontis]
MSLTSFLKDEEVRNAFRKFFKIPKFNVSAELLAPTFTENYSLAGTAFDYLLRFYVKRLNRDAMESPWASEKALDLLFLAPLLQSRDALPFDTGIIRKAEETIEFAKKLTANTSKRVLRTMSCSKRCCCWHSWKGCTGKVWKWRTRKTF